MLKRFAQRLLRSKPLYFLLAFIYGVLLGPFLISAPSTVAVIVGLAIFCLLVWWAYNLFEKKVKE